MASFRPRERLLSGLMLLACLEATPAHADNKLFPTDILQPGQMDASASLGGTHAKYDFVYLPIQERGTITVDNTSADFHVRYGVGSDWHVGTSVVLASTRSHQAYGASPTTFDHEANGIQGIDLWAKRGFSAGNASPLSLSTELGVSAVTSNTLSKKAYSAAYVNMNAGWAFNRSLKGDAEIGLSIPDRSDVRKTAHVSMSAWVACSERLTVIPNVTFRHFSASTQVSSADAYNLGLAGLISLSGNMYLRPSVAATTESSRDSVDGLVHYGPYHAMSAAIQIYSLF